MRFFVNFQNSYFAQKTRQFNLTRFFCQFSKFLFCLKISSIQFDEIFLSIFKFLLCLKNSSIQFNKIFFSVFKFLLCLPQNSSIQFDEMFCLFVNFQILFWEFLELVRTNCRILRIQRWRKIADRCKNYLGLVQVVNLNFGYCKANLVRNLGWNTGHTLPCRSWDAGRGRDHLLRLQWKDCFLNLETQWQIYGCCSSQCVADLKLTKIRETVLTNYFSISRLTFFLHSGQMLNIA